MKKNYAIYILICTFYIITCTNKTDVFYDPKYDIIFHNGKLYFPSKNTEVNNAEKDNEIKNIPQENPNTNQNHHASTNIHHEEELVSGPKFWFYLFVILCKFFFSLFYIAMKIFIQFIFFYQIKKRVS